jgi:hypothetical protein
MSVDPLVMETGELYAYAGDDPVNRTDPTGLCAPPRPGSPEHLELCEKLRTERNMLNEKASELVGKEYESRLEAKRFQREADELEWWLAGWKYFPAKYYLEYRARIAREAVARFSDAALEATVGAIFLERRLRRLKCPV